MPPLDVEAACATLVAAQAAGQLSSAHVRDFLVECGVPAALDALRGAEEGSARELVILRGLDKLVRYACAPCCAAGALVEPGVEGGEEKEENGRVLEGVRAA